MPDDTPLLSLPLILPNQAQKHVTHNEALQRLDLLVQLTVQDRDRATPPALPSEGDCHIVATGAGDWTGQDGAIAAFSGGGWQFIAPRPGWSAWVLAEDKRLVWRGGEWSEGADLPGALSRLGISTTADTVNRLAVAAPASLFTHAGAGHQIKLNKAAPTDTASLLFQTGWSGRAEIGLAGADALSLKVSADGIAWITALQIDPDTGAADLAASARIGGALALHHGNLLGSVAMTAGLPTGAVLEQGQSATGSFLRLADGTQICTHRLTGSAAGATLWTYPQPFSAPPVVTGTAESTALSCLVLETAAGATSVSVSARDAASARRADALNLLAVGRWA